jgi:hypothetical protein
VIKKKNRKRKYSALRERELSNMRYAQLIKLGGHLIEAEDADYEDYFGFLICPECKEPVFLRKGHRRTSKLGADHTVPSSFIHHRSSDEIQTCEQRVAKYSAEKVESFGGQARDQRIAKLKVSMWKYLKHNHCVNLNTFSKLTSDFAKSSMLKSLLEFSMSIVEQNSKYIVESTLPHVSTLLLAQDSRIGILPSIENQIKGFLKKRKRNWSLQQRCAAEALELLLTSTYLKPTREKLIKVICHPLSLEFHDPELLDLDTSTEEWRLSFASYLTLVLPLCFLTVDWLTVFDFLPPRNPFHSVKANDN